MFYPHTILHPTDFSRNSQNALHVAADLARTYDADLMILYVHTIPVAIYAEGMAPPIQDETEVLRGQLDQIHVSGVRTTHQLVEGDPVSEILRTAEDTHTDVIVMGTHGRRGLSRLLMGSVAELVVRGASCPVLTVHLPKAVHAEQDNAEVGDAKVEERQYVI